MNGNGCTYFCRQNEWFDDSLDDNNEVKGCVPTELSYFDGQLIQLKITNNSGTYHADTIDGVKIRLEETSYEACGELELSVLTDHRRGTYGKGLYQAFRFKDTTG